MYDDFRQAVWEVLCTDDVACEGLLAPLGGLRGTVALLEGDLSVPDALAYAHGLVELGQEEQARELFEAVMNVVLHMPSQGDQQAAQPHWVHAMGDQ